MTAKLRVHPDLYVDSVFLLTVSRSMLDLPGIDWAAAVMGTPANLDALAAQGFEQTDLQGIRANDLVVAVRAGSSEQAEAALETASSSLRKMTPTAPGAKREEPPRSLEEGLMLLPNANLALISVPGPYAALEAHKALTRGLHVLLFSDNVPLSDEIELKSRAERLGLLMMGPGAGTSALGGTGLGFANGVRSGRVGVVAAAGTGAQELMSLIHRWGAGVSAVVGVGGRDLSDEVGGRMARLAIRAFERDANTEVLLLVSKPPSPSVAASILGELGAKPAVAALVGLERSFPAPPGVHLAGTMEEAAATVISLLGMPGALPSAGLRARVAPTASGLAKGRRAVRGLFSGGTLCYETMALLAPRLGPVFSNVPLREEWSLPAPPGTHVCIDLGDEQFTRGRPHPMIDVESRGELIGRAANDPTTAVILIDVVLGHGAHPDPAAVLAPTCREVIARSAGPAIVTYVLGTDRDPQGYADQCQRLQEAGCLLAPTCVRAALMAAAIASRNPEIAEEAP